MLRPPAHDFEAIATASSGLMLPSESDAPFVPIFWEEEVVITPALLRAQMGLGPDAPVCVQDLDPFFAPLVEERDWFTDAQRATARRFTVLRDSIATRLAGVSVYLIGETTVHVMIIGSDSQGATIGLHTYRVTT